MSPMNKDEPTYLKVRVTVDPPRFQSLHKLVTKRKWLPTVLNVRRDYDSGFPNDHSILVAECRVKLGAKILKTSRSPT